MKPPMTSGTSNREGMKKGMTKSNLSEAEK